MSRLEAMEEYQKALKLGQKEAREAQSKGRSPNPEVLYAKKFTNMSLYS